MLNATSLNYSTTRRTSPRGKLEEFSPRKHWRRVERSEASERRSTKALGPLPRNYKEIAWL